MQTILDQHHPTKSISSNCIAYRSTLFNPSAKQPHQKLRKTPKNFPTRTPNPRIRNSKPQPNRPPPQTQASRVSRLSALISRDPAQNKMARPHVAAPKPPTHPPPNGWPPPRRVPLFRPAAIRPARGINYVRVCNKLGPLDGRPSPGRPPSPLGPQDDTECGPGGAGSRGARKKNATEIA